MSCCRLDIAGSEAGKIETDPYEHVVYDNLKSVVRARRGDTIRFHPTLLGPCGRSALPGSTRTHRPKRILTRNDRACSHCQPTRRPVLEHVVVSVG